MSLSTVNPLISLAVRADAVFNSPDEPEDKSPLLFSGIAAGKAFSTFPGLLTVFFGYFFVVYGLSLFQ